VLAPAIDVASVAAARAASSVAVDLFAV